MKAQVSVTAHAQARSQQRGVDPHLVELLLEYGARQYSHGCRIFHFQDRKAQRRLRKGISDTEWKAVERKLNAYAVVADSGALVTVGRRYKPVRPS